jgi:hypothetical protein
MSCLSGEMNGSRAHEENPFFTFFLDAKQVALRDRLGKNSFVDVLEVEVRRLSRFRLGEAEDSLSLVCFLEIVTLPSVAPRGVDGLHFDRYEFDQFAAAIDESDDPIE